MGKCTQSDEYYIGTPEGVVRTKDVERLSNCERYQVGYFKQVGGTPWQPQRPETTTTTYAIFGVTTYIDSDWAGCATTSKFTIVCTMPMAGVAIHHYSRRGRK